LSLDRINAVLNEAVESNHIAGANILVYHGDRELFYGEAGYADIENKVPIRRDTIFRLYSMTKPVAGAAAMLLMQRGVIDLHEPVSKYLPGFANQHVATAEGRVRPKSEVRLIDLLRMTSGISYGMEEFASGGPGPIFSLFKEVYGRMSGDDPVTTVEFANRVGGFDLSFHPGEHWQYGLSADVLGAVIEVASGKSFGQFLKDELFGPLGMKDTDFYIPPGKQARRANTYMETENGLVLNNLNGLGIGATLDKPAAFESGGAGLASTADDYMLFARMLMRGGELGGVRILSPATVRYFTTPQLTPAQAAELEAFSTRGLEGFNYGNLMRILTDPGRAMGLASPGEYGWDGALGVYFMNAPAEKLSIVFMTQRSGSGTLPIVRRIRNIIFTSLDI
jgi:CubicO group peptidase (beta-lactamase class C family)